MTLAAIARRVGLGALDLVFPPRCLACGKEPALLCGACVELLVPAGGPRCDRCWRPGVEVSPCSHCRLDPPAFDGLRSSFVYDGVARHLVHALKYRGMTAAAVPMAALMARTARVSSFEPDAVVPVPLTGWRKRTRGYNQAESLARALGRELGVLVQPDLLRRTRQSPPQARAASSEERLRNVAGAFRALPRARGLHVLLIDDVTTTGATLGACAVALRGAGAVSVRALTFARED
jgi:ComF family protein